MRRQQQPVEPPLEDSSVRAAAAALGLPGIVDLHVHLLPTRLQARVWEHFDAAGPLIGLGAIFAVAIAWVLVGPVRGEAIAGVSLATPGLLHVVHLLFAGEVAPLVAYMRGELKIDGAFVQNMAQSAVDQAMVKSMNEVAHALGLDGAEVPVLPAHRLAQMGVGYVPQGRMIAFSSTSKRLSVPSRMRASAKSSPIGSSSPVIGAESMTELLKSLEEDEDIEGIILRVNSPGGGAKAPSRKRRRNMA